jgi:hypothetical protein
LQEKLLDHPNDGIAKDGINESMEQKWPQVKGGLNPTHQGRSGGPWYKEQTAGIVFGERKLCL